MRGVKLSLRLWPFTMVRQFALLWLFGVIFESVLCSPLDVHRIVLKTHGRTRDRDHHKSHADYRHTTRKPATRDSQKGQSHADHKHIRKPAALDSQQDEWFPVTTRRPHHSFNSYRSHHENESRYNRVKPLNRSTPKPLSLADAVQFTTSHPEKLPVPVIESAYKSYQIANNSLDLYSPTASTQHHKLNFKSKVRQHREKEITTPKTQSKGYEVYEEIIGDVVPPPQPRLKLNLPSVPIINTPLPAIFVKDEDNHIKENVTDFADAKNKTYGRRTKGRRNRGNIRFDEVKLNS